MPQWRRGSSLLIPRMPPRGPDWSRPGPDAVGILSGRNVWDTRSPDFAKNRHFGRLHGGAPGGPEKPVILFTACLNDPPVPGIGAPLKLPDRGALPNRVEVDGQAISLLGIDRVSESPLLAVERCRQAPSSGADILMYRELYSNGFYEWGASGLFIGPNNRDNAELRLCYMVGEFWAFLAHLKLVYSSLELDAPFTVRVSVRNARGLVLGNYGDEVFGPSWDIHKNWSFSPDDPRAGSRNIQWQHTFGCVGEMADGAIARAARAMADHICAEYGEGTPRCYGAGGAFCWRLWRHTRRVTLSGCQQ